MVIEGAKENILDQIEEKIKGFQDEIREIKESLSSQETIGTIETKLENIKQRAKAAKEELEETIGNMRENVQEKFKTTLESLNDIINTKISIGNKGSGTKNEKEEDKTFWDKRYGKVIKYSGIGTVVYYVAHGLKTGQWNPFNIFDWKQKENSESNENFKCKGGEYLGMDISSHNGSIDLNSFMDWNRTQRDSDDNKKRGVSLMYIRASDNVKTDKRVGEHVNNVCNYNNQVNENEKIAVGFYHRLSGGDWKAQADKFIETYKQQSQKLGGKKLIPMVDVEDGGTEGWVTQARNSNNKEKVRSNTLNWINYVEKKLGITPGIYASDSVNKTFFGNDSRFNKYKKWIARYGGTPTQSDMHQYTQKGKVGGFNNSVDLSLTSNVEQFLA